MAAEKVQQKTALESKANELLSEVAGLVMINNADYPAEVQHGIPANYSTAEHKLREVIRIRQSLHGEDDWVANVAEEKLAALLRQRIPDEATVSEVVKLMRRVQDHMKHDPESKPSDIADNAQFGLGDYLNGIGKLAEAESYYREAIEIRQRLPSTNNEALIESLVSLASNLASQNKSAEAKKLLREALKLGSSSLESDLGGENGSLVDWDKLKKLETLARLHVKDGELGEAAPLFREADSISHKRTDRSSIREEYLYELADAYSSSGKLPEAEAILKEKYEGETPIRLWKLWCVVHAQNRFSEADQLLDEAVSAERNYQRQPWLEKEYIRLAISGASTNEAITCLELFQSLCNTLTNGPSKLKSKTMIWRVQGELLAKERQFAAASAVFARAFQTNQEDRIAWRCAILSAILSGDEALPTQLSNHQPTMLSLNDAIDSSTGRLKGGLGWYSFAVEANKRLFAALLPPVYARDFSSIQPLVQYVAEYETESDGYLWLFNRQTGEADTVGRHSEKFASQAHAAKALAEFRQKQYSKASATIKKALHYDQQAIGYAILALTQAQAVDSAAAKASIEKGFELNQREKEWDDRLVVEILLKEAKGLVESKSPKHDASK